MLIIKFYGPYEGDPRRRGVKERGGNEGEQTCLSRKIMKGTTDAGSMNFREQTIYRLVPLDTLRLRTKQLALFLDDSREDVGSMAIKRHNSPIYI